MYRTTRLQGYLWTELLVPTLLGLALYTFTLLMNEFFLIARQAVARDLAWDLTLRMFAYQVPRTLVLTIPMATLLGTMIAIGRLSADHEWVALQGAGLGPSFLVRPVAWHGLAAALVSFYVYAEVFPASSYAAKELFNEVIRTSNLTADLRPRVFYDDLPGVVLFVNDIRPGKQGQLEGVFVYQPGSGPQGTEQIVLATKGDLYPLPGESGIIEADLRDGVIQSYRNPSPENYLVSRFGRYQIPIKPPPFLVPHGNRSPQRSVQDMDIGALFAEARAASLEKDTVVRSFRQRSVNLEIHHRFALPAAALLFALLAMPLGVTRARSGKGAGFAVSMLVIFVYWILFVVSRNQASRGRIPVALGVWGANLAMLAWVVYAYLRMNAPPREPGTGFFAGLLERARSLLARVRRKSGPSEERSEASIGVVGLADRYLTVQYLKILGMALLSAYLIYGLVELKGLLDGVFQNKQPMSLILQYFKYFTPGMLQFALPVSCLAAGVITFTLLARRNELTALKSAGMSVRRAVVPVLVVTAALCGVLFLIQDKIAPVTNRKALAVRDQIFQRAPRSYGSPSAGRWVFGSQGRLYQYRLYDPTQNLFQGVSVFRIDLGSPPRVLEHIHADSAHWEGGAWVLTEGWRRTFPEGARGAGRFEKFDKERFDFDPPENFSRRETTTTLGNEPDQMSLEDLSDQIDALRGSGYDITRLQVARYAKLAHPFTPLVMLLLGLPFAFRVGRSGSLYAIAVSLVLAIVYWATLAVFQALGLETILPPLLAACAPNVFYGFLGAYLMLFVRT